MRYLKNKSLILIYTLILIAILPTNLQAEWYDEPTTGEIQNGEFTINELVLAGHDFFGTATEGLGIAIETIFSSLGRPDAYIIGEEASAAFIAGLTYGEGTISTKTLGEEKIFWQGPSIGFDTGADGSRIMFLIYNLDNVQDMYKRFPGTNGTAYIVGGMGGSFYNRTGVTVATIKTGAGLRLGANIGYIKFSDNPKWLPF
tara:strand:- start:1136 stop:1738 length:603 start_codon:yes stop_codon:yes gene_type:complete